MGLSTPGIYNALDAFFGAPMGMRKNRTANENQMALQAAIGAATGDGGGIILIPSDDNTGSTQAPAYPINTVTVSSPAAPLLILGTGVATKLQMQSNGDIFDVSSASNITFQDLTLQYSSHDPAYTGAAINFTDCSDVGVFRVMFERCQYAVILSGTSQATIYQCTSFYETYHSSQATTFEILGGSSNVFIRDCLCNAQGATASDDLVALGVQDALRISCIACRFDGYGTGVAIAPPSETMAQDIWLTDIASHTVQVEGIAAAALIQPQAGAYVRNVSIVACQFKMNAASPPISDLIGGVYIDNNGTGTIDTVRLISCDSTDCPGPGISITSGSNIEILGGSYSGNGSSDSAGPGSAGISITGGSHVRVVGASCVGTIFEDLPTQLYGLYIGNGDGAPAGVVVRDCDLTGNADAAVAFSDPGQLYVTNSAGYNDEILLNSTTIPTGFIVDNSQLGYYGPFAFYIAGGSSVNVSILGHATGLGVGGFALAPGQIANVSYGALPSFLVVGK